MRPMVNEVNIQTGEAILREMDDIEYAAHLEDQKLVEANQAAVEAKEKAKASALAKLAALGLTEDEIAAL